MKTSLVHSCKPDAKKKKAPLTGVPEGQLGARVVAYLLPGEGLPIINLPQMNGFAKQERKTPSNRLHSATGGLNPGRASETLPRGTEATLAQVDCGGNRPGESEE
jgi:hypothetical protein